MKARQRSTRRQVRGALVLLLPLCAGCGSRGDPRPPVYPGPPAIAGLTVAQRGSFAILRFPEPPIAAQVGADDVELEEVQVLAYAERYPVITAELLIAALDRRSDVMATDAADQAAAADARAAHN